ncbi:MAG: tetratricopeptide repeat protein [Vicinamibacteraceae bacterium]
MPRLDSRRWQVLSPHLDAALELSGPERAHWLESLRAQDPALADDLHALLVEHKALDQAGFLVDSPPPPARVPLWPPSSEAARQEPISAATASLAGQTVGAYTLMSYIGHGGMGTVWRARRSDGRFEGLAAIKLLNASLVGQAGEERFVREGTILARLAHPSIAHLIDAGVSPGGQPYLVLEYVQGEHIDRYCDDRRLDLRARIRLFLDVLAAVAHAHANLVVHRDIKPSNVLVRTDDPDGKEGTPRVKLLDFGIAKLLELDSDAGGSMLLTRESGWALTPAFAAPEQLTGGAVTTATDVYALGVLLYLLLSGKHPAGANLRSPAELIAVVVDTDAPRLSSALARAGIEEGDETVAAIAARRSTTPDRLRRALRGDLETIVAVALKKDPRERYPSVMALADDLQHYLAQRPIRARPDTWIYRATTFVRRHVRGLAMAAAGVVLLAGLTGFYTVRLATERDRARLEAEKSAKVSELLAGLLAGADPYATRESRGEPTVRELLDAGAERVQKELAGQPELQAEMMTVIGRVYQRLGLHDRAQPLLEQALSLGRRAVGPNHVRVAQSLNDLGVSLREKSAYDSAIAALEEALALRRRLLGEEHKDVAVTLVELGRAYADTGRNDRAEPLLRTALAIRRKVLGEVHQETATSLSDLGLLLREQGELSGAEALLRQCLTITRKVLPDDHPDVATSIANVALVTGARGDHAATEALFRQALAIRRKAMGPSHPSVAATLNNLSNSLREQGKHDEAAVVLDEALTIARATRGGEHPLLATFMVNRARVHLAQGEASTAAPLLERALQIRRRVLPEDDWRIAMAKSFLGESLTALGRYQEAETLLIDAHRILKDTRTRQDDVQANIKRLVALYQAWGRPDEAAIYRSLLRS